MPKLSERQSILRDLEDCMTLIALENTDDLDDDVDEVDNVGRRVWRGFAGIERHGAMEKTRFVVGGQDLGLSRSRMGSVGR